MLINNENGDILAYFALSFKEVDVKPGVSKTTRKKLDGINKHTEKVRSFLIGQMGKNFSLSENTINLSLILKEVYSVLGNVQDNIGGRTIFLECENNRKLISLYENLGFSYLQEKDFVQMYKVFNS